METNFFQNLSALQVQGNWVINVTASANNYIVSVLLKNDACGDDARKVIPPLILKGTPQEIDEGFFNAVAAPVKITSQLFVNMEAYVKGQEEAAKHSQMQKDKATKEQGQKSDKKRRYDEVMQKVNELDKQGKHREAWAKVPDAIEYSEYADEIRSRKDELEEKFAQGSLFSS